MTVCIYIFFSHLFSYFIPLFLFLESLSLQFSSFLLFFSFSLCFLFLISLSTFILLHLLFAIALFPFLLLLRLIQATQLYLLSFYSFRSFRFFLPFFFLFLLFVSPIHIPSILFFISTFSSSIVSFPFLLKSFQSNFYSMITNFERLINFVLWPLLSYISYLFRLMKY